MIVPEDKFPYFAMTGGIRGSPQDHRYNCIAWAAGETHRFWWPKKGYWPAGIPEEETVTAFIQAFTTLGYNECPDGSPEQGIEKVAIYALNGVVKHAARQMPDGNWTSKMGSTGIDTEHVLNGVAGPFYGYPAGYVKRPRRLAEHQPRKRRRK